MHNDSATYSTFFINGKSIIHRVTIRETSNQLAVVKRCVSSLLAAIYLVAVDLVLIGACVVLIDDALFLKIGILMLLGFGLIGIPIFYHLIKGSEAEKEYTYFVIDKNHGILCITETDQCIAVDDIQDICMRNRWVKFGSAQQLGYVSQLSVTVDTGEAACHVLVYTDVLSARKIAKKLSRIIGRPIRKIDKGGTVPFEE